MQNAYGHIVTMIPDAEFQADISDFLTDIGFDVSQVDTLDQTQSLFDKNGPDLVITDLGDDAQEQLNFLADFSHSYPDVPIITLTQPSQKHILKSLRLGAWDCIEKPIEDIHHLEHAVCKAFERARLINENKLYRYKLEEMNQQLEQSLEELRYDQLAGKKVQEQLRPNNDLTLGDYQFSHIILPSLYLSGDVVDYFTISENQLGFYIADVSGHGASSAFVAVMIKTLFDQMLHSYRHNQTDVILQPKKLCQVANKYLIKANLGKYLTMVYGVLDTQTNELKYSVAGHYPCPVLVTPQKTEFLNKKAFAIGMVKQATYQETVIDFPPDATLALFSDGLLEEIAGEDLEDKERILLNRLKPGVSIANLLAQFNLEEECMRVDDITMLLISRHDTIAKRTKG